MGISGDTHKKGGEESLNHESELIIEKEWQKEKQMQEREEWKILAIRVKELPYRVTVQTFIPIFVS
jgi:hypothetical protein